MNFDILEAITKRISTRSFSSLTIPTEKQKLMIQYIKQQIKGPFGSIVNFNWVDMNHFSKAEVKKFGSFGIKNRSNFFVVGSVLFSDYNMEDFGYLLEKIVLYATHIDLSSSWLSPFFNHQAFSEIIGIDSTQSIPAIVMIGFPLEKISFSDKTMRLWSINNPQIKLPNQNLEYIVTWTI